MFIVKFILLLVTGIVFTVTTTSHVFPGLPHFWLDSERGLTDNAVIAPEQEQ